MHMHLPLCYTYSSMSKMKHIGVVMFGGTGQRFGSDEPKQFLPCGDHPLMAETLCNIASMSCLDEIYVVTHPDYIDETNAIIDEFVPSKIFGVIPGGDSRHESVENALGYFEEKGEDLDAIIAIFDGDRPGIDESIVSENMMYAEAEGAAVTAIKATDSVFLSYDHSTVHEYLNRDEVYLAQTPQTFRLDIILEAYRNCENPTTDDASLVAALGYKVSIVEGSLANNKITYPEDLARYLSSRR